MIRAAILALGLVLIAPAAQAQRAGAYAVAGSNPGSDVTDYEGVLTMAPLGTGAWEITWRIGREVYRGIGLLAEGVLAVAYVTEGAPGVVLYRPQDDGTLVGTWTVDGRIGTERLTPR